MIEEAEKAKKELENAGIRVLKINDVLVQKLRQDVPGQLGAFCKEMSRANVNILTQYSDHSNRLIVVVDNHKKGKRVFDEWMKKWWNSDDYVI
ncbi:hypothetical protein [Cytophaga sp. FL35]|uniref:hypothetical protein n=1 Tax=Cytophaga sp. FL35 TaxID=1904456 RepID=UPI0025702C27|nr:hypothetical protein [Cytophaga sp. FL35]